MNKTDKMPSSEVVRIVQALAYLLSLDDNGKMERIKLIKLLWAADRYHMRKYGRTISESRYLAMPHGPVCSLALDIAKLTPEFALADEDLEYISTYFTSDDKHTSMSKSPGDDRLSKSDKLMLKRAFDTFNDIGTFRLADKISHDYPEWKKYAAMFDGGSRSSKPIDKADFFKNPGRDKYFGEDDDALAAAYEAFVERRALVDALGNLGGE